MVSTALVRPELNIAKYANIFFPASRSSTILETRRLAWVERLEDGTLVKRALRISPSAGFKAPSQSTYIVLLALFQIWQQTYLTDGSCVVSYRRILRFLGMSSGPKNVKWIEESLISLRETSFYWEKSFLDPTGVQKDSLSFNILAKLECQTRNTLKHDFTSRIVFKFDDSIQRNLEHNKTKPFRLDVLKSIRGGYARALYTKLDLLMSSQLAKRPVKSCSYERLSRKLFEEDLGISLDKKYRLACRRREKLEEITKHLEGKEISRGAKLKLAIIQSVDMTDWKLQVSLSGVKAPVYKCLPTLNEPYVVTCLMEDLELGLKANDFQKNKKLYAKICRSYPQTTVYQALSEFKGDIGDKARNRGAAFVSIMRRLAYEQGMDWLK